jgi:hypothetical protein
LKIGDISFEDEYIISSQSEGCVRELLASPTLRKRLIASHFDRLTIKGEEFSMWIGEIDKRYNDLCNCLETLRYLADVSKNITAINGKHKL